MSQHLQPGSELRSGAHTYIIRSVLGSGGFGITYSATFNTTISGMRVQVVVAVKEFFLSSDCERDANTGSISVSNPARERAESAKKDFIGEARRLQQLGQGHHNIISVSEVFEANNTAYYVMEFVEGESLQAYVKRNGALSEAATMAIMRPVVDAVAFLHRNRITHLDIKPANIMLSTDEHGMRPVLIDFGLSKHYNADGSATSTINSMGYSEGYSPIEQYTGISEFSPQSDVYSLAATIVYCLTGKNPSPALKLKLADIDSELQTKGVSAALRHTLLSALSLQPENRPADASALLAALGGSPAAAPTDNDNTRAISNLAKAKPATPSTNGTHIIGGTSDKTSNSKGLKYALIAIICISAAIFIIYLFSGRDSSDNIHHDDDDWGKEYPVYYQDSIDSVWYADSAMKADSIALAEYYVAELPIAKADSTVAYIDSSYYYAAYDY